MFMCDRREAEEVRQAAVRSQQRADLVVYLLGTIGTGAGLVTHHARDHLEKIAGQEGVVGRRQQERRRVLVERTAATLTQEGIERGIGTIARTHYGLASRVRAAGRRVAKDAIETVVEVLDQAAVDTCQRARELSARSAWPQEHADEQADEGADQQVLDTHDPDLPAGR